MARRLTREHEALVERIIAAGRYTDGEQAIGAALRLLEVRAHRLDRLRGSIAEGLAAIERGEGIGLTPGVMEETEREAEAAAERGETPNPELCPSAAPDPPSRGPTGHPRRLDLHGTAVGESPAARLQAGALRSVRRTHPFPELGRVRPEYGPGLRTYRGRQHVVVYQATDAELRIARVLHERRDAESDLRAPLPRTSGSRARSPGRSAGPVRQSTAPPTIPTLDCRRIDDRRSFGGRRGPAPRPSSGRPGPSAPR
jgi:plasmid stabilization system protein ParE/Arc/MetJ-type ribon-helix-helix transcriptional regulator